MTQQGQAAPGGAPGLHNFYRRSLGVFGMTRPPVNVLNRVSENNSRRFDLNRKLDFERVALRAIGNGNYNCESSFCVVNSRGEHECRMPTPLLVTCSWVQIYFDDVAGIGNVGGHYQASLPTDLDQPRSGWRFLRVVPATRDSSVSSGSAAQ